MSEPPRTIGVQSKTRDKGREPKQRTLTETLLISAWVAGYAGVLAAFRVARLLESLTVSKRERLPEDRNKD